LAEHFVDELSFKSSLVSTLRQQVSLLWWHLSFDYSYFFHLGDCLVFWLRFCPYSHPHPPASECTKWEIGARQSSQAYCRDLTRKALGAT